MHTKLVVLTQVIACKMKLKIKRESGAFEKITGEEIKKPDICNKWVVAVALPQDCSLHKYTMVGLHHLLYCKEQKFCWPGNEGYDPSFEVLMYTYLIIAGSACTHLCMVSFSFIQIRFPTAYALSSCTTQASASTGIPFKRMSSCQDKVVMETRYQWLLCRIHNS